ncbi:hypothetical protein VOM14_05880 [Paraburkholderia sp. MPAMCS5]|uniref:hypothetical protein n=1 Tax=Paraburkholderia sp. MPAMCS5 TaxID=3112563 RepID=UPI002E184C19|nr:hypothetical protein [Paraburkholderia sp. MPAMCS5]
MEAARTWIPLKAQQEGGAGVASARKVAQRKWVRPDRARVREHRTRPLRPPLTLHSNDLQWPMARASGGAVNLRNPKSGARGLFQLLPAQYALNPNGIELSGHAVDDFRSGIR